MESRKVVLGEEAVEVLALERSDAELLLGRLAGAVTTLAMLLVVAR